MEELGMSGWNQLGVVGTIYEEENEDSYSSSPSTIPSPEFTPSPTTQLSGAAAQPSSERRHDPDVVIHVQDSSFRLHKGALTAKSTYLKGQLTEFPEITLSPPLNITAQTFSLVTDFCYGSHVAVTPFNVAAVRTAAELLGMTEDGGGPPGEENLQQKTEAYFRQAIYVNKEYACIVLRSCFPLLPEAETAAALVSRCVEALALTAESDGDMSCLEGFKSVAFDDLQVILESVSQRLTDCHDLLYRIIDIYLKENIETVSEDEKIQMCNHIDCSILTPRLLMHAVQNPKMPLRFVVQAMFLQQLNTRHSIISAATSSPDHHHPHPRRIHQEHSKKDPVTLGAILERDAALRQVSQLKSIMTATNSRIQTLEKELHGMRQLLNESESVKNRAGSGRSASFRFSSEPTSRNYNKIERGQMGSISASSFRSLAERGRRTEISSSSEESYSDGSSGGEKSFGQRLMSGLKSAFRLQKKKCSSESKVPVKINGENLREDGNKDNIVIIKKDQAFHRRTRSRS
ncbi:hypothetical protein ABFS82_12G021000 [Erythranthe guttata]|uniref:BTB/POZ domain-containing protein At3g49900 isoform X2 n=1 Tax=Erythranthe guttata TaxID=4155 RepID=UPI00064DFCA2|nr:PREDICTED: BTB/POZ domain-containing protein At3g49900 isoform X2 [Erythranthe guttata]|eukprot:XP_012846679.1 PREDICTED: BTB/POZ domain-containing protein At3g49900 isoform X2 [Erythranthe guttata]